MAKQKKALAPRLPMDAKEIRSKGFTEDISSTQRFITDGHTLILREFVTDKKLIAGLKSKKSQSEHSIAALWNQVAERKHRATHFIGCGQVSTAEGKMPVAILRDSMGRYFMVNPWILAFCVLCTGADTLTVAEGRLYAHEPLGVARGNTMVGMVMGMRYLPCDFNEYDLNGMEIALGDAFVEKQVEVKG